MENFLPKNTVLNNPTKHRYYRHKLTAFFSAPVNFINEIYRLIKKIHGGFLIFS